MGVVLIYSTHPTREQARDTADLLLERGLAACCNIVAGMESHYIWQGSRERSDELLMFSKTTDALAEAAMEAIRRAHPYECPAILQWPVSGGNPKFLQWIESTTETTR